MTILHYSGTEFFLVIFPTPEKGASRDGGAHRTLAACMEKVNR